MIYLASPYTHLDPAVEHRRYVAALEAAAHFVAIHEVPVYSPVAYGHSLARHRRMRGQRPPPTAHDWWMQLCLPQLGASDEVWVLTLEGWRESRGVAVELAHAQDLRIPVYLVDPGTYEQEGYEPAAAPDYDEWWAA